MNSEKEKLKSAKQMVCDLIKIVKDIHCSSMMRLSLMNKENEEIYFENLTLTYNLKDAIENIIFVEESIKKSIVSYDVLMSIDHGLAEDEYIDIEETNGFLMKETKNGKEKKGWKWYLEKPDQDCNYSGYEILKDWMGRNNIYSADLSIAGFYGIYYFQIDSPVSRSIVAIESPEGKLYKIKGRW